MIKLIKILKKYHIKTDVHHYVIISRLLIIRKIFVKNLKEIYNYMINLVDLVLIGIIKIVEIYY